MATDTQFIKRRPTTLSLKKSGKYVVDNLYYPMNVSTAEDNQHYVGFYINVPESSTLSKETRLGAVSGQDQNRIDAANSATAQKAAPAIAGLIGAGIGAAAGGAVGKLVGGSKGAIKALEITGGVVGGVAGAATNPFKPERILRLDTAIMLAIQSAPSVKYRAGWEEGQLGQIGGLLAGGASAADATKDYASMSSDIARALAMDVSKLPNIINATHQIQNYLELTTQRVSNPQREQLFKAVDFRTFRFDYRFMPKSEDETFNVQNIIDKFKFHMHPELTAGGLFYIYPSTFDIVYYYGGDENNFINRISTCALTDMQVTYGGKEWATFDEGAPVEINVSLTFVELEIMTKSRISEGF